MRVDIVLLIDDIHTLVFMLSLLISFKQTGYHGQLYFRGMVVIVTIYAKKKFKSQTL
jgi:hypothetical protein